MPDLSVSNAPPRNKLVDKLLEATSRLKLAPPLIEVRAPALVIGDLHGDCNSLIKALELLPEYCSDCRSIVFLGDYIDRGPNGLCVIDILINLYLNNSKPEVVLLRGNHETRLLSSTYGFLDEVRRKYSTGWKEVFDLSLEFFSQLPYTALISNKVLAVHGGLPNKILSIKDLANLKKGLIDVSPHNNPIEYQLLWNDPAEGILGYVPSKRGHGSYLFGPDVTTRFLRKNNLNLIIRSHTPQVKGYAYYHNNTILSIFTCKYYGFKTSVALIPGTGKAKPLPLH